MTFHAEVMPETQQRVLRHVGPIAAERGFYLGGGTAVAIQLGHRRSVDFDWFTQLPLMEQMRLAGSLRAAGAAVDVADVAEGALHAELSGVRLSFFEYRYPLVGAVIPWTECGCSLASLEDLACMKLSAISSRGARKDFIDVYALGRSGLTLSDMLSHYTAKYDVVDVGHVLFSLTFFDDAEAEEMPDMLWDVSWQTVKRTVEAWTREYVR